MRKATSIHHRQPARWPAIRKLMINVRLLSWREHMLVLAAYLLLSVALTWPLVPNFTTSLTGQGEIKHMLWTLWHTKEAVLGHDQIFSTSLLYYPFGSSLLTHSLGPLLGVVVLPFWVWGPAAAMNAATLIAFWMSGYCMYVLARGLGFGPGLAFFSGVLYLVAPRRLSALYGHTAQIFTGLLPLSVLMFHRALDRHRSRWWAAAVGLVMLLSLLHSSEQFVFAGLGLAIFALLHWFSEVRSDRKHILKRGLLVVVSVSVLTSPLLVAILIAASDPNAIVARNLETLRTQPDLLQFLLPVEFSRLLGSWSATKLVPNIEFPIETAMYLSWTGLLLSTVAILKGGAPARRWALFTMLCIIIALGPVLRVMGETAFTDFKLPMVLPFAFISSLPGLDFWRTPGRFMLIGVVGFSLTATYGLAWLRSRLSPKWGRTVLAIVVAFVLAEVWPYPWPQEKLRPVPAFYQQIAQDPARYGVFDLPIRPTLDFTYDAWQIYYSSYYQIEQMVHGKGIVSGYLSRFYEINPAFGHFLSDSIADLPVQHDILLNGRPANRLANALLELARYNYRYVVFHKPQSNYPDYQPGAWGELQAQRFLKEVFGSQAPLVDDALTTVYQVSPLSGAETYTTTLALRESNLVNWIESESNARWAMSPATFYLAAARAEPAYLEITPSAIREPQTEHMLDEAVVTLDPGSPPVISAPIAVGKKTVIPLLLSPGSSIITLTTEVSGSLASGQGPSSVDFAIGSINLRTWGHFATPPDLLLDGRRQNSESDAALYGVYGTGWYPPEQDAGSAWRWAQSPARLYIYSAGARPLDLALTLAFLHEPASPNYLGAEGVLTITTEAGFQQLPVRTEQPATILLELHSGWNTIVFELAMGNFDSQNVDKTDHRQLSFAIRQVDLRTQK